MEYRCYNPRYLRARAAVQDFMVIPRDFRRCINNDEASRCLYFLTALQFSLRKEKFIVHFLQNSLHSKLYLIFTSNYSSFYSYLFPMDFILPIYSHSSPHSLLSTLTFKDFMLAVRERVLQLQHFNCKCMLQNAASRSF